MKIDLPKKVREILDVIEESGHEAYVVGGCVRDSILGRQPEDWDITTSAKPEEVKALFRRTIDTGIAHGTVTVMMGDDGFEVTTYRVDGKYEDGRHPSEVLFTPNLKEDLRRRDFTINAMAYNEKNGLVDLYNGVYDLKYKNIRCVGNADERFDEDALRILRAVRFAAQLDFGIERETYAAICRHAENLRKVSSERIQVEIVKLLTSPNPESGSIFMTRELPALSCRSSTWPWIHRRTPCIICIMSVNTRFMHSWPADRIESCALPCFFMISGNRLRVSRIIADMIIFPDMRRSANRLPERY